MNTKIILASSILFIGLCFAGVVTFAKGDEAVTEQNCFNVGQATQAAEAKGGKFVALVDVPGDAADQVLVVDINGLIQVWPAWHGCMVAHPLALFESKKPDRPV